MGISYALSLSLQLGNTAARATVEQESRSPSLSASAVRGSSPLTRTLILSSHICHALLQRTHTQAHQARQLRTLSPTLSLSLTLSELSTPGYSTLSRIVFAEICFSVTQHLTTLPSALLFSFSSSSSSFLCHRHRLGSLVLMSYKN